MPCVGPGRDAVQRWKDYYEEHIKIRASKGMYGDDEGEYRTDFYCAKCMAHKWGCEEGDAITRIRDGKPHIRKRRAEQAADRQVVGAIPGASKGAPRPMAIDVMKDAMGLMVRFVRLKTRMLAHKGPRCWTGAPSCSRRCAKRSI